ncbi:hypothetical protein ABB37_04700 [Leptomonas pyrrhocoris]|uniref:Uncharacterized protein n=1 Tax=Leptomonas pyrrhocoris TaxID=157538 RepID=A0A0M9G1H8_LEPPY|nr:hypothetical protein ABB37_04700 [Leptomonas pyrrhocoris]KPA80480.1 hypothetical protein ABB37_04700 [Leptomonas pyrrhocoris]|eukprot:XP_015658919.1 hypothetical protein ABB37_04700 [Leptomonas pyrrhocoris]
MRAKTACQVRVQDECRLFWHGVVESFGVEWKMTKEGGGGPNASAVQDSTKDEAASAASVLPSPPLVAPSFPDTDNERVRSPPLADTTARPSPVVSPGASALGEVGVHRTVSLPPSPVRFALMPPWSLVEYDPKMWMLLRKNLVANLALMALTVTYMALSHSLAATSRFSSTVQSDASSALSPHVHSTGDTSPSRSLTGWIAFCWLRLFLWMLKYMGQWPFYTVLQIIGLVWYNQLYRETWLVRKGWVLRGTRLREASPLTTTTKKSPTAATTTTTTAFLSPLVEGVTRPWLAPISLNVAVLQDRGGAPASTTTTTTTEVCHLMRQQSSLVLHASIAYGKHVAHLLWRMLRHKGPTAPLQEWVLGDAAACQAVAGASSSSSSSPPSQRTNPDIFEAVTHLLESTSEIIFKALATMSFALFASCVEGVPFLGTPLCLLLNAQLYAFYVFDYRYAMQQQPGSAHHRGSALAYQLRHFEQCWVYYAGYGIGSAILSLWLTHRAGVIVSVCTMSVLYSWQVVWSGFAVPLPSSRPLPLFSLWFCAVDMTQKQYAVLWRSVVIVALLYIPYQCFCYI